MNSPAGTAPEPTVMDVDSDNDDFDMSYEPFSRESEYIDANRLFIRALGLRPPMTILDVACGTGTMSDLMLEGNAGGGRTGSPGNGLHIVGVDLSRESLRLGWEHLTQRGYLDRAGDPAVPAGRRPVLGLLEGSAERLPIQDETIDLVIMGNAIQLVGDRDALFSEVHRVLRPNRRFAFNTSFYAGTYCHGTEHVYLRWVQEASVHLAGLSAQRIAAGLPAIKRHRGRAGRAFSKPWLSIEEYADEMARHGLRVLASNQRTVMLNRRCFEAIGAYAGLAKVLLSGYPVKLACEALETAAGRALELVGMHEVPRFWLEMIAEKEC